MPESDIWITGSHEEPVESSLRAFSHFDPETLDLGVRDLMLRDHVWKLKHSESARSEVWLAGATVEAVLRYAPGVARTNLGASPVRGQARAIETAEPQVLGQANPPRPRTASRTRMAVLAAGFTAAYIVVSYLLLSSTEHRIVSGVVFLAALAIFGLVVLSDPGRFYRRRITVTMATGFGLAAGNMTLRTAREDGQIDFDIGSAAPAIAYVCWTALIAIFVYADLRPGDKPDL